MTKNSLKSFLSAFVVLLAWQTTACAELPAPTTPNPGLHYYNPFESDAAPPVVEIDADVIVYGGTSGGVIAAIQAARMGKSVALVEFGRHVGGLPAGGLTATDGAKRSVQGPNGVCLRAAAIAIFHSADLISRTQSSAVLPKVRIHASSANSHRSSFASRKVSPS
ncbi:MAG: FAD-dependent oxidoreductase [Opitutales bacterium]